MMMTLYVQLSKADDQYAAAGRLLDLISKKLDEGDGTALNQCVYALVQSDQLCCARMIDDGLTEQYLHDRSPEHG